jgi:hypothetical protein
MNKQKSKAGAHATKVVGLAVAIAGAPLAAVVFGAAEVALVLLGCLGLGLAGMFWTDVYRDTLRRTQQRPKP